ncbi:hypothetical protein HAX54_047128 [Datura stramonium]|uniref:Uncharacterized protein n=1 Tax=Datura stramonium TaxID=4076 RepID=A0ABS8SSQ1_DATST|nr:hypothetical protein [Datura stramonium]
MMQRREIMMLRSLSMMNETEESSEKGNWIKASSDKKNATKEFDEQEEDSDLPTIPDASMDMVCEFYANYYCTLEKNAPLRSAIKKEPVLDSVWVRAISVDISKRTITQF